MCAPLNSPLPVVESIFGSTQFGSEDLIAYEAGYRVQATSSVSLDLATFYNYYTNLRSAEPGTPIVEGGADSELYRSSLRSEQQDERRNLGCRTFRGVENSPQMEIARVL